ncbi:MAG: hypothetical protein ACYS9T_05690 [Planctomycetota bacterium]|jgi:hypothetical protein
MKKVIITSLIVLMVVGIGILFAGKGNKAPKGKHHNLNIIGVPNQKNDNFDGGNGSRIFVKRTGVTTFYVHGGNSYEVLDHDGTDGKVGEDRLNPGIIFPYDATRSPTWRVQIWVRLLGPKGSEVNWRSYYYDTGGATYVLWSEFTLKKETPSKFTEKTGSLLRDGYQDMLWELDPVKKFRICQMRIYLLDK